MELERLKVTAPAHRVYMRYYGQTVASTPQGRLQADLEGADGRLFMHVSNAVADHPQLGGRCTWDVFHWTGESKMPRWARALIVQSLTP